MKKGDIYRYRSLVFLVLDNYGTTLTIGNNTGFMCVRKESFGDHEYFQDIHDNFIQFAKKLTGVE